MSSEKLRNIGPKSAAWLRQVGLRSRDDLQAVGAVEAYMRVKRAGFRPGLNLLYAIEGALLDCHWQEIPDERRHQLVLAADEATALLPPKGKFNRPPGPVTTTHHRREEEESGDAGSMAFDGGFDNPSADGDD